MSMKERSSVVHVRSMSSLLRCPLTLGLLLAWACVAPLLPVQSAAAQSPILGTGAMQPSVGKFYLREQVIYRQFDGAPSTDGRDVRQVSSLTQFSYGILNNLSINLDIPLVYNDLRPSDAATGSSAFGFADLMLDVKWRVWQEDLGPTDTLRFALVGGVQIPGGTTSYLDSSEGGWNPVIGAVFSAVLGRHGFNLGAAWEFNTEGGDASGEPDTFTYEASYLFRLSPAVYGETTSHAAWYLVGELNGVQETNGNSQVFLAPGIMYEATWWTAEAFVQLPVYQSLEDRPDAEVFVGVGLRFLF